MVNCKACADWERKRLGAYEGLSEYISLAYGDGEGEKASNRQIAYLLGEDGVRLAKQLYPELSLAAYVDAVYGSVEQLRQVRREAVHLTHNETSARRASEEEIARRMGVTRDELKQERIRQGRPA